MTVAHRDMKPADRPFVISGWSSSFRTSEDAGLVLMSQWSTVMHAQIEAILQRPDTRVIVACEPGELVNGLPFLYGFIALRTGLARPYVYYCYVKSPYREGRRRHGLVVGHATGLFAAAGINPRAPFGYACRTGYCTQLASKIPASEWSPLVARFEAPHEQRSSSKTIKIDHRRRAAVVAP